VGLGLLTFLITKYLLKVSPFIPAPLIALAVATGFSSTVFAGKGLTLIKDKYGAIPTDFFVFNMPAAIPVDSKMLWDLAYFVAAIIFVSAVESLLCSRIADRMAENKGAPFNPNKELWGQSAIAIYAAGYWIGRSVEARQEKKAAEPVYSSTGD
jgi:sulfate permease, SulP family